VNKLLLVVLVATAGVAQQPPPNPSLARGIYLERAASASEAQTEVMHATLATDSRSSGSMKAMFGGRPTIVMIVTGAAATLRLSAADPSFRIVLTGGINRRGQMPDLSEMSQDAPSPIVKDGKDFALVRLTVKDDTREVDIKNGRIAASVEKVGDNVYRLKPNKPLEPGEYGIVHQVSGMPTGQVWAFGIGAN